MFHSVKRINSDRLVVVFGALLLAPVGLSYVGGSSPAFAVVQEEFYVSPTGSDSNDGSSVAAPFQTLENARQAVDAVNDNMTGDIVVYLLEGTYTLTSTFTLGGGDSGSNGFNVIYKDYEQDAGEAVISGGVDLGTLPANWEVHDATNNIYKLTGVDWAFRQLYVNGKRAVRARAPNVGEEGPNCTSEATYATEANGGGYYCTTDETYPFDIFTSQIDPWWDSSTHSGTVEFVWNAHWNQWRARIASYAEVSGTNVSRVTFTSPERTFPLNHHPQDPTYFFFENALALLDAEGEWFLDKTTDTLYYKLRAGETISTAEMIAPRTEILIELDGTDTNPVHHLQFYGLSFKYNNWTGPDLYGYWQEQGGHHIGRHVDEISPPIDGSIFPHDVMVDPVPGMVDVEYAHNLRFERNAFEAGGSWGVMEYGGSHDNTYVGNLFRDLSSGAITIGNNPVLHRYKSLANGTGAHDVIRNNLIDSVGRDYRDSVAIMALRVQHLTIDHNEVRNVGYTGISVGFEHNDSCDQNSHHNGVSFNRVQHVMQVLDDGGGIYTLGCMSESAPPNDSVFHRNFVNNLITSDYAGNFPNTSNNRAGVGIYLDGAASYQTYIHNVIDNAGNSFFASNQGPLKEHDNVAQLNHYNVPEKINNDPQFAPPFSVWQGNEDLEGLNWTDVSKTFMNAAGLEEEYRDIGNVTTGFNVAQGKSASASSVSSGTPASMAIDNDVRAGLWASDLVQANPYWQVDLGREYNIYQVDVVARQDADHVNARRDFEIRASNDPSFSTFTVLGSQGATPYPDKGTWSAYVDESDSYRYLRVQRTNNGGHFAFAEFRAFGTVAPPTNGMAMWLDANEVTRDANNKVSSWTDQSGAGNPATQGTASQQPLWVDKKIVGRPVVRFDGVDDNLSAGLTGDMDEFTLFFVLRPDTTTDFNQRIGAGWGKFNFHTTSSGGIYAGTSASSRITPSDGPGAGTMQTGVFQQFTYRRVDTGHATLYKNGALEAIKQLADPADWTGFGLGATVSSSTLDGDLAEVIVYNRGLSEAERQTVEEYLATKYVLP